MGDPVKVDAAAGTEMYALPAKSGSSISQSSSRSPCNTKVKSNGNKVVLRYTLMVRSPA